MKNITLAHPKDTALAAYRGRVRTPGAVKGTKDGRDVTETTGGLVHYVAGFCNLRQADSIFQARVEVPALQFSDTTI